MMKPWDIEGDAPEQCGPSRSHKKRESAALQKRGEEMAALSPAVWKQLPLPPELLAALKEFHSLKSREARRRQLQYIGRLMRELDEDERAALLQGLDAFSNETRADAARLHGLEEMRNALMHSDEDARDAALAAALRDIPALDAARLRHLVDAAMAEREKKRSPRYARELFRYLRDSR